MRVHRELPHSRDCQWAALRRKHQHGADFGRPE